MKERGKGGGLQSWPQTHTSYQSTLRKGHYVVTAVSKNKFREIYTGKVKN